MAEEHAWPPGTANTLESGRSHTWGLSCFSRAQLFATVRTIAHQAPLSMAFSRQEYWSGMPFSSPGDLPDPRIEPESFTFPALAGKFFTTSATWMPPSVQFSSVAQSCLALCDPMDRTMPVLPVHCQLPEFTQTHVHGVGDAIQPSHPLSSLLLLPSIFPSIRVFSNESVLHIRWSKYWSFSFSISPFTERSRLISFRIDQSDVLAVQGTLSIPMLMLLLLLSRVSGVRLCATP